MEKEIYKFLEMKLFVYFSNEDMLLEWNSVFDLKSEHEISACDLLYIVPVTEPVVQSKLS